MVARRKRGGLLSSRDLTCARDATLADILAPKLKNGHSTVPCNRRRHGFNGSCVGIVASRGLPHILTSTGSAP